MNWKKRQRTGLQKTAAQVFLSEENESTDKDDQPFDWVKQAKAKKAMPESKDVKAKRLVQEGMDLAEKGRFWEAITRWDESLETVPNQAKIYEMKAQVLMELNEIFPAVDCAKKAVFLYSQWAIAYQTLGKTQLDVGNIGNALKNFQRAFHIDPLLPEIYREDICWCVELQRRKKELEEEQRKLDLDKLWKVAEEALAKAEDEDEETHMEQDSF